MIQIRLAEVGDAAALANLQERTFRATFGADNNAEDMDLHCRNSYSAALQAAEIGDPALTTLVCEHERQLVAFVQLHKAAIPGDSGTSSAVEIKRIYLDSAWHGQGLAQQLMDQSIAFARSLGAAQIWLGVWERNPRAIGFYKKFGFVESGEHTFMVGSDPQRDLIFTRAL